MKNLENKLKEAEEDIRIIEELKTGWTHMKNYSEWVKDTKDRIQEILEEMNWVNTTWGS